MTRKLLHINNLRKILVSRERFEKSSVRSTQLGSYEKLSTHV